MLNAGIISDWLEEARSKAIAEGRAVEAREALVNCTVRAESPVELLNH